jgi:sterol desaturase/sphingolipid hydroxylase (fatty acid hydroxylase superfamily)
MHCPQLIITSFFFFGAGGINFLVHTVRNRQSFSLKELFKHCVPFDIFHSKSFHMDVMMNIIHAATDSIFRAPGLFVMALVSNYAARCLTHFIPHYAAGPFGYLAAFICVISIFVAVELSDYIVHYYEHKIPILWELHKVHHSADCINPLTSRRGHSIPLVYSGILVGFIVGTTNGLLMFLFNISFAEAMVLSAVQSKMGNLWTLSPLKHSHIPVGFGWFDKIFISPHMHQVHHSKLQQHWDKNFGNNLSIFDWLFNTGYKPARGEKVIYGIAGYSDADLQMFNTLNGAFISPILRIKDRIWKGIGAGRNATASKSRDNNQALILAGDTPAKRMPSSPM